MDIEMTMLNSARKARESGASVRAAVAEFENRLSGMHDLKERQIYLQDVLNARPEEDGEFYKPLVLKFMENVTNLSAAGGLGKNFLKLSRHVYYENVHGLEFSRGFREKIYSAFDGFPKVPAEGWKQNQRSAFSRLKYSQDLFDVFIPAYDPDDLLQIQGNRVFLCAGSWSSMKQQNERGGTSAYYSRSYNTIFLQAYTQLLPETPQTIRKADYQKQASVLKGVAGDTIRSRTGLRAPEPDDTYVLKKGRKKVGLLYIPAFGECRETVSCMAHEITHMVTKNVDDLYSSDPAAALKHFHYTEADHNLHVASMQLYVSSDKNYHQYRANASEVLARSSETHVNYQCMPSARDMYQHMFLRFNQT